MNAQEVSVDPLLTSPADSTHSLNSSNIISTIKQAPTNGDCEGFDDTVWKISEEQRNYYTKQFRKLQPDLSKLLPGEAAKNFFQRSRLSTDHLTKIWNLSDITRDGSLSLPEFLVAMHLVVAKRNNISLPTSLPPPLLSILLQSLRSQPKPPSRTQEFVRKMESGSGGSQPPLSAIGHLQSIERNSDLEAIGSPSKGKEWTKFIDSPTSVVSSPGIKPVNFDFERNAVEKDPLIYHPVARKVSPDAPRGEETEVDSESSKLKVAARNSSSPPSLVESISLRQTSSVFHRPLPKKPHHNGVQSNAYSTYESSQYGPASLPMVPAPSTMPPLPNSCKKDFSQPPPPPPPRGSRSHTRSSSLDLNKFNKNGVACLGAPPAVPPRASPASSSSPPNKTDSKRIRDGNERVIGKDFNRKALNGKFLHLFFINLPRGSLSSCNFLNCC